MYAKFCYSVKFITKYKIFSQYLPQNSDNIIYPQIKYQSWSEEHNIFLNSNLLIFQI